MARSGRGALVVVGRVPEMSGHPGATDAGKGSGRHTSATR